VTNPSAGVAAGNPGLGRWHRGAGLVFKGAFWAITYDFAGNPLRLPTPAMPPIRKIAIATGNGVHAGLVSPEQRGCRPGAVFPAGPLKLSQRRGLMVGKRILGDHRWRWNTSVLIAPRTLEGETPVCARDPFRFHSAAQLDGNRLER